VHLVGFTIEIYCDARSYESPICFLSVRREIWQRIFRALQSAFRCRIAEYASRFIVQRVKHFNYQGCDTAYDKDDFASNKVNRLKNTELLFYRFSDHTKAGDTLSSRHVSSRDVRIVCPRLNCHGVCRRKQASHARNLPSFSRNQ
jgi:hypothetical protein